MLLVSPDITYLFVRLPVIPTLTCLKYGGGCIGQVRAAQLEKWQRN